MVIAAAKENIGDRQEILSVSLGGEVEARVTAYRHLGIDYEHILYDLQDRPMPILPFGEPIEEILAVS